MNRSILSTVAAGSLLLAACAAQQPIAPAAAPPAPVAQPVRNDPSPVIARILQRGELVVATSGDQPPLSVVDKQGQIIGLEADLARAIADAMGVRLTLVRTPFNDLLPALERGSVDAVLSGLTMTAERNMKVAMVGPYFMSGKTVLARADRIKTLDERREISGRKVRLAALAGSTSQAYVEKMLPEAHLTLAPDYEAAVNLLVEKKVDALVADFPAAVLASLRHPKVKLQAAETPLTFEPLGIALPPTDPLLVNVLENILAALDGSGALEEIVERWTQDDSWLTELP